MIFGYNAGCPFVPLDPPLAWVGPRTLEPGRGPIAKGDTW
jgi:hypothetical protein